MCKIPSIFAIILAWNFVDDTKECLESLLRTSYENFKILLVDNGSQDGTSSEIKKHFPKIRILTLKENVGIARGYNEGIKYAYHEGGDLFLIINNDTIVTPEMVSNLFQAIQNDPTAGIAMPKIYHYFGDRNRLWCVGARWRQFPPGVKLLASNKIDKLEYSSPFDIEYAPSCCLLIKKEVVEQVGLFDPNYFFYYDDWDYSDRVRKEGYRLVFEPSAVIWHKVALSTTKSEKPSKWWFTYGQSSVRYFLTHKSSIELFLYCIWFVGREIFKFQLGRIIPFLQGIGSGIYGQSTKIKDKKLQIPRLGNDEISIK